MPWENGRKFTMNLPESLYLECLKALYNRLTPVQGDQRGGMKTMKKVGKTGALILIAMMMLFVSACGGNNSSGGAKSTDAPVVKEEPKKEEPKKEEPKKEEPVAKKVV